MFSNHLCVVIVLIITNVLVLSAKKANPDEKPSWAKKDIRDYSDADMERLLDQWEEDEEPLEPDELPEHLRPLPNVDFDKLDMNTRDPEDLLKMTKKGRTLMMFVSVLGNPTRDESEELTKLWQGSLWNNHIQADRFMIDDDRAIFMFKDGALAYEAKDFLIQQDRCKEVTIENKPYYGKNYQPTESEEPAYAEESKKKKKAGDEL